MTKPLKSERVLILGVGGMLGSTIFKWLSLNTEHEIFGTARDDLPVTRLLRDRNSNRIVTGVYAQDLGSIREAALKTRPTILINCIGIIKQRTQSKDPLLSISVNSMLPHCLASIAKEVGARLILFSSDCVFSGRAGLYRESDIPDPLDLYGRSKLLGEISAENVLTLRTSIVGHELNSNYGLIEWFLSQKNSVKGYTEAIFSGLTTLEVAKILYSYVINNRKINGLYHLSGAPINKYSLLKLVSVQYNHSIQIEADSTVVINRSLDCTRFKSATGYAPRDWEALIRDLQRFQEETANVHV
jgi:dTDP-4-dehydrorhamnose reductase